MSTLHVTVYTAPGCFRCSQTVRRFRALGVEPEIVDVTVDTAAAEQLRQAGHLELPVVTTGAETWSDYRLEQIRATAAAMTGTALAS